MIGQLLPVMKKSDGDDHRIVLVSSDMHRWPKYEGSHMNYTGDPGQYSMFDCYGRSKLYQVKTFLLLSYIYYERLGILLFVLVCGSSF